MKRDIPLQHPIQPRPLGGEVGPRNVECLIRRVLDEIPLVSAVCQSADTVELGLGSFSAVDDFGHALPKQMRDLTLVQIPQTMSVELLRIGKHNLGFLSAS